MQMIVTSLSILAVDFTIFPRRYAKAETYGSGLVSFSKLRETNSTFVLPYLFVTICSFLRRFYFVIYLFCYCKSIMFNTLLWACFMSNHCFVKGLKTLSTHLHKHACICIQFIFSMFLLLWESFLFIYKF